MFDLNSIRKYNAMMKFKHRGYYYRRGFTFILSTPSKVASFSNSILGHKLV